MAKHTSYRGQIIDIEMMKYQNQHDTALGNANMNARGDKIGQGGTIIKTREELLEERERRMQLPDFIPEHTSHSVQVKTEQVNDGFDDSMFEVPEPEPVSQPTQEVQETEAKPEVKEKAAPRRVRASKDGE